MENTPFLAAADPLSATPGKKWGARICSVLSALALAALAPVLYLFADLVIQQGRLQNWTELHPRTRQIFHESWDRQLKDDANVKASLVKIAPGQSISDPLAWWAVLHADLAQHVSPAAADVAFPASETSPGLRSPSGVQVGMLATVARHHGRSTAPLLGWFASWNPWTWTNESFLVGLFLIAGLLVLARGILLNVGTMLASSAALTATTRVRRAVYAHSLRLGALATQPEAQLEAGDALTRRAEQLLDGCVVRLTAALQAPVLAVSCTLVLFAVKFWLGLAMVLLVGAVWLLAGQSAAWFRRDARLALRRTEARLGVLRENMTMMRLIKSYLMERFNQTRVERHLRDLAVAAERRLRGETIARPTLFTIVTLTGIILTFVAARVVLGGGLTPAGLLVQLMALAGLAYSIQRWIAASVRINRSREAVEALAEFLDRRPDAAQPIDAEFLQPLTRKLELNEVSYREAGTGRMIFDGLTLSIPVGERVAIICTESESQSLANLLTRFIDPTGGEVRLDGKNSRWMTFESVRTQIATVLQDSLTFSDTVATNIGCGEASFTLPQMIEAAKLAHAHQFVQRLPYGYETPLGDHGHSLRPGERFRIALARAVLRDPSVLVIEEPNEPYDPDSVALIEDALARFQPGRTIIILARRLNRTKSLDRVFVLHHGKLAASGSPDQVHGGSEVHKVLSTTRPGT